MKKTIGTMVLTVVIAGLGAVAQAKEARTPTNDDTASARVVEALPFSETVNIKGATLEPDETQPTCGRIRGSVWYALSAPEDGKLVADISTTFASTTAVLEATAEGLPAEVACSAGRAGSTFEFEATAGKLYLVQLGATTKKQGVADVSFRMSSWKEITLVDHVVERKVDEQRIPLARVKGQPRPSDPSMYDVTVVAGSQQQTVGVLTYGLVRKEIDAELLNVPAIATKVHLQITARYDSSQYRCAIDDGSQTCYAGVPLRDPSWLTGGDASRAELVVTFSAEKDGVVLVERSQVIPYAGQVFGLIP